MQAALPSSAPAKPKAARRVLVLSACSGFVHSCIPLVDKTVEELGTKTKAWTTTITYDPADINTANLAKFDLVFLNNTTGAFLDERDDPGRHGGRARRRCSSSCGAARGSSACTRRPTPIMQNQGANPGGARAAAPAAPGDASGSCRGSAGHADDRPGRQERRREAGRRRDERPCRTSGSTRWTRTRPARSPARVRRAVRVPDAAGAAPRRGAAGPGRGAPAAPAQGRQGRDTQMATWPDFNRMIGGYFKWHWLDPTHIDYKIDDPKSPLTKMFVNAMPFSLDDETYTFSVNADSYSRANLHVLTSIDFAKMSGTEKAKQDFPREDDDYGLSWIRREGKGRVFYEAHGHNEKIYAIKAMLEHITGRHAVRDGRPGRGRQPQPEEVARRSARPVVTVDPIPGRNHRGSGLDPAGISEGTRPMNRTATIVTTWAAAVLTAGVVLAQQPPAPATGAPGAPGARGGLQQRDPNRCSAPGGFGAASYVSPEPLPDGRVTFRLCAPDATTVSLGSSDNEDIAPNSFMGGSGRAMTKDSKGLWSVTTEKALAPDTYRYFFFVNGVRQPDPAAREFSLERSNIDSLVEVKGPAGDFQTFHPNIPHGQVARIDYWSEPLGAMRRMHVYTPPGYEKDKKAYPVLYLVHGAGDSDHSWATRRPRQQHPRQPDRRRQGEADDHRDAGRPHAGPPGSSRRSGEHAPEYRISRTTS